MKGILKRTNDKWYIHYMDWKYEPTGETGTLGNYRKKLDEFIIELDPSDVKDVEQYYKTNRNLENKEVRFAFKQIDGNKYARLKNPYEQYPLDEIEQEILNETFKNSIKYHPTIDSRLSTELGFKCLVCEATIKLSEVKQMCDDCLSALKTLILEKRANPNEPKRKI